eukprot:jgi/Mesen1/9641/ME000067S09034
MTADLKIEASWRLLCNQLSQRTSSETDMHLSTLKRVESWQEKYLLDLNEREKESSTHLMAGTSAALEELSREAKNWSLASDAKLLLWMKAFGERVERRTRAIHLELSELSCQVSHMDVSVKNASNHLASLGSSQFVENRVSEDVGVRTHGDGVRGQVAEAQASKQVSPESLEAAITARYRQAAQSGWQAVQQALDYVPSGTFVAPEQAALGHTGGAVNMEEALRPLPHVIGTEAFAYDNSCGLAADAAAPRDYSVMLPYGKQGSWLLPGVAGQEATRAQEAAASSSGWSSSAEDDKGPEHLVPNPKEDTWSSAEEEEEEDLESDSESALRGGELGGGEEGKARVRRAKVPPGGGGAGGHTGQRTSETEPAVFAADNFRAMLEAALRGPSEYDGGMVHEPSYLPEVSVEGGGVSLVNDDYITDSMPPGSHAPVSSREEDAQSAPAGGDGVTGGIRSHDDLPAVPSLISPVVQGGTPQVVPGGGTSESQLHGIKDLAAVGDGTGGKLGFASTLEEVLRRGQREGLQPKRIISTNQRTPLGSHLGHEETGGANVEHRGKDSEAVPARIDDRTIPEKSGDGATGNGRVSSTQAHVALPFLPEEEEEEGSEEEDEDDSDIFGSLAVNKARGARPSYALSYEDLLGSGARASLSLGRGARPPPPPLPPAPPLMSRLRPQGMGARGPSGDGKEDDEGDASVYVGRPEPSHSQKRREETLLRGLVSDAASSNSHGGGDNDDNGNASALRSFLAAPQQKAAAAKCDGRRCAVARLPHDRLTEARSPTAGGTAPAWLACKRHVGMGACPNAALSSKPRDAWPQNRRRHQHRAASQRQDQEHRRPRSPSSCPRPCSRCSLCARGGLDAKLHPGLSTRGRFDVLYLLAWDWPT